MMYNVKDMVYQQGSYYFLLENNADCTPLAQGNLEIWVDDRPVGKNWQFDVSEDFFLQDDSLLVLQTRYIPVMLKRWKKGKQTIMLKAKEETIKPPMQQPIRYATKLERHKRKWWIFTWYD